MTYPKYKCRVCGKRNVTGPDERLNAVHICHGCMTGNSSRKDHSLTVVRTQTGKRRVTKKGHGMEG